MPRTRNAVIGILIGLVAMGIVGQLRGGPSTDATAVAVSPVPAITEMGGSLRPVEETVLWRQGDHEHEYHGITYVAGALRIYERLAGLPRPQADQRFAQTLMNERVPGLNLGYSSVAEAYLNFGIPGVVVIFLATGLLLGAMERRVFSSPYLAAALGAVTFVLAYEVRQSANIMLTLFAGVAVLTLFVRFLGRPKTARKHTYQLLAR